MKSQALTIIEADSEPPLLPLDLLPIDAKRSAFGLYDLVRLGRGPRTRSEIRMVLAIGCWMCSSAVEGTLFVVDTFIGRGGKSVDFGDL